MELLANWVISTLLSSYLKNGADIESLNLFGDSPLMIAIKSDHYRLIKFLIYNGANVNIKCQRCTPLDYALMLKYKKTSEFLTLCGAESAFNFKPKTTPTSEFLRTNKGNFEKIDHSWFYFYPVRKLIFEGKLTAERLAFIKKKYSTMPAAIQQYLEFRPV